ncbi:hypothetical protein BGT96224_1341 [Blumeria graminis f. sp. tritici 96224]|uniref:Uncharacterized protein n=1 Tax=Blumeria graminis f. sp. tritici 96224 TaxID=1268274 RepID=A0A656KN34_BLUGR|nr:hypothetical protein BGT96224_1341 [Blumeria graminis f. sp. tritici 96224]
MYANSTFYHSHTRIPTVSDEMFENHSISSSSKVKFSHEISVPILNNSYRLPPLFLERHYQMESCKTTFNPPPTSSWTCENTASLLPLTMICLTIIFLVRAILSVMMPKNSAQNSAQSNGMANSLRDGMQIALYLIPSPLSLTFDPRQFDLPKNSSLQKQYLQKPPQSLNH